MKRVKTEVLMWTYYLLVLLAVVILGAITPMILRDRVEHKSLVWEPVSVAGPAPTSEGKENDSGTAE